ncbi:MAG: diguanylate cyclase [Butyrivibrio sp.]|nr:diguanylate cyclase [Butyrivibrio sp.]
MENFTFDKDIQTAYEQLLQPIAIFHVTEEEVKTVVVSRGFCELFGYADFEQAYKDMENDSFTIVHPDDVNRIKTEMRRFLTEEGRYEVIYRSNQKDGTPNKLLRSETKFIHMDNGVVFAHVWYMDESTDVNQKIIDLAQSVTALLTNMPAMTFSKDVLTRKYLACNQAFADYANKETPDEVVGLTDFEIFDEDTALHFIEDDKKALAMDKPYIFYEDVPDAAGNPRRFQTTKLKFVDTTGKECLLGLCQDITEAMQIKKEYGEKLAYANDQAQIDALTGIRNKYAYNELEQKINDRIKKGIQDKFAITVFDVNDLKKINDTLGHQAGDEYIRNACKYICTKFRHSPVFRIGGDEFVTISEGEDYENIDEILFFISENNKDAKRTGGMVIAFGMSSFSDNDEDVASVFMRADKLMYENKNELKKS